MTNTVRILLAVIALFGHKTHSQKVDEFCIEDTFSGECSPGEVIKIQEAKYGRMKIGKCVKQDMGFLGCSIDAVPYLDKECSGKTECTYPVFNSQLHKTKPCKALESYLEVAYKCIPVLKAAPSQCESSPWLPTNVQEGFISSYIAKQYGCGSIAHPWRVDVSPGQRVNVTLTNFNVDIYERASRKCVTLGHIHEHGHQNNVTICSKSGKTDHIYTSTGRSIDISIAPTSQEAKQTEFILHYKVFGCADINVPEHSWYKREGNAAVIGCENEEKLWHLSCVGNTWDGIYENCSAPVIIGAALSRSGAESAYDFKAIAIVSITVGIIILIIISGVIVIIKCRDPPPSPPPAVPQDYDSRQIYKAPLPPVPQDDPGYYRSPGPQEEPAYYHTPGQQNDPGYYRSPGPQADPGYYRSLVRDGQPGSYSTMQPHQMRQQQTMPRNAAYQQYQQNEPNEQYSDYPDYEQDWSSKTLQPIRMDHLSAEQRRAVVSFCPPTDETGPTMRL